MKNILIVIILSTFSTVYAQEKTIAFQKNLTWAQVKEKAKRENKYIFLDAYTTWCAPCRVMDREVFTQSKVYDFFNTNFINVAVQFDVTKNDSPDIKKWYTDAAALRKTYQIGSYPTYLFFNPQGQMVHVIKGANTNTDLFIADSKKALDPKTQYVALKKQYDAGKRSTDFLKSLANAAAVADPKFAPIAINTYLKTQKDLLTQENLRLIARGTKKSTDPGFQVMINHPEKVDSLTFAGNSKMTINDIVFEELILPEIKTNGKKIDHGGIFTFTGEDKTDVNWDNIRINLSKIYPSFADEAVLSGQLQHYEWTKQWQNFAKTADLYIAKYGSKNSDNLRNQYANRVFVFSSDSVALQKALQWAEQAVQVNDMEFKMYYSNTYSDLLYKTGRKEEAIALAEDIVKYYNGNSRYAQKLEKMKNGIKTWSEE